jgi:hypothetical protein
MSEMYHCMHPMEGVLNAQAEQVQDMILLVATLCCWRGGGRCQGTVTQTEVRSQLNDHIER